MTESKPASMLIVVDRRSFEVTTQQLSPKSSTLTVVVNDREQWSFDVAGWRGWACGVANGGFYIWTARQLIEFAESGAQPTTREFDEDLLLVFWTSVGWLAICESSVRQLSSDAQLVRIEIGDVIETARWRGNRLIIQEQAGAEVSLVIRGDALVVDSV